MISIQIIAFIALAYLLLLFLIAYLGDLPRFQSIAKLNPNVIYALSLAVYCSSWTFYGAVGTASVIGLDYIAIYLGPCLVFLFGYPVMRRIIMVCKQNNITSISDFIASRYGKNYKIGVLVTVIAVVGSLPYIALQLKAVSLSFLVLSEQSNVSGELVTNYTSVDTAFYTGAIMALFAVLFGTRHLDATEHHSGMVLAISFESIVKLVAILVVGFYASHLLLDASTHSNFRDLATSGNLSYNLTGGSSTLTSFLTKTFLAMGAIILLPRQFQMTVVEANSHSQFKTAMWVMPIYLLLTTLIVMPIAFAGTELLPNGKADLYVLTLPLAAGNQWIGLFAFIGGLSAATGMVIVAVISLSTMVCNDLVMPNLIRIKRLDILNRNNLDAIILLIRRLAIVVLMVGSYGYFRLMDENAQLANIGLVSFAAVVQFFPAVICAIFWKRANSKGVFWGLAGGFLVWGYTLMLPTLLTPETVNQIWSDSWSHPESLLGNNLNNPLTHGVFWSLLVNSILLVLLSLRNQQSMLEQIQASRFFHTGVMGTSVAQVGADQPILVHPDALRIIAERIIGIKNTQSVFSQYESKSGIELSTATQVDRLLISLVQTAIAGVIGSASAQKVISDVVIGEDEYLEEVTTLVDETSSVLQFNRHLLQTTLQNITHGISVIDEELNLVIWNQRYIDLFEYPENFIYVGKPISEVLEFNARRGDFYERNPTQEIRKRLKLLHKKSPYQNIRTRANDTVIKSIGEPMPNGGFVTTYEDITESVRASELLYAANEELEDRVAERTKELIALTEELEKTTRSKTHFLAAASHDLLQPINAARLFAHSILEGSEENAKIAHLAESIDDSLVRANQLLRALLDISRFDSGGIRPNLSVFDLKEFIANLVLELEALARDKSISLVTHVSTMAAYSDHQLLSSVLQNLVTNAIRYTPDGGRVEVTVKDISGNGEIARISILDSGVGIDASNLSNIFNEFYQVEPKKTESAMGLGLGLSIVERISKLLDLQVEVESTIGQGSCFSVNVPLSEHQPDQVVKKEKQIYKPLSEKLIGLKVICIDNNVAVLNAMQTLVEGWGCSVTSVSTYNDGVEAIEQGGFKIVLADYRLDDEETGLDFLNFSKEYTKQTNNESIQGVLVTAEQDKSLEHLATSAGFHYLSKPVAPAALKSILLYLTTKIEGGA